MFLHSWDVSTWRENRENLSNLQAMCNDFNIKPVELDGAEILLASYGEDYGYDGLAFVLYRKDDNLYEVNGSHCSCYGLEGQWAPEETTKHALIARLNGDFGNSGGSPFHEELRQILETL